MPNSKIQTECSKIKIKIFMKLGFVLSFDQNIPRSVHENMYDVLTYTFNEKYYNFYFTNAQYKEKR